MKTLKYILSSLAVVAVMSSCVSDLDVTPIDPNMNTADKALTSAADFEALLAGIYTGYGTSGFYGPNGDPSISGLDGGMSQYVRGLFHLCELSTDVYVCGWNDEGVPDVCKMQWDASTGLIYSIYSRMFFQIAHCNEFIREANATSVNLPKKDEWIAEARALRALSYYHAIDNFGNVPFADESSVVGQTPKRITRAELYAWLEEELKDIIDNSALPAARMAQYGHIDKGAVKMILAKLYLNAEVYTGTAQWAKCADVLKDLMDDGYSLHTAANGDRYSAYQDLFLADNDQCKDEMIFAIEQDGNDTQSYGVTNYLVFAFTGGSMVASELGISSGWAGCRATPDFYQKFSAGDARALFWTDGQTEDVADFGEFTNGIGFQKYRNIKADYNHADYDLNFEAGVVDYWLTVSANGVDVAAAPSGDDLPEHKDVVRVYINDQTGWDVIDLYMNDYGCGWPGKTVGDTKSLGGINWKYFEFDKDILGHAEHLVFNNAPGKAAGFVDIDFPVFRYADVLLMAAECEANGAAVDSYAGFNAVRARAGLAPIATPTLQEILDERARELYLELWRRQDLVRAGQFTGDKYIWQWKGGVHDGQAVEDYKNLFPIPTSDLMVNPNLVQNEGY